MTEAVFREEFRGLLDELQRMQKACGWSDRTMVSRYRQLGSTRTWRQRLCADDLTGLNLERQARQLRELQAQLAGGTPVEVFHSDLPFAKAMDRKLARLEGQSNDRRILVALATTGCGKSAWARHAVAEDRSSRVYVRLRPSCREKKVNICTAICDALGDPAESNGEAATETKVITLLRAMPRTIFIDEAHEGGVALMKLIRAFVDETSARFVYLAYPTEYERVRTANTGSIVEAQQFIGRTMKPIFDDYAAGTTVEDVAVLLQRELGWGREASSVAAEILPSLRRSYNLRLLADAIDEAKAAADELPAGPDLITTVQQLSGVHAARRN